MQRSLSATLLPCWISCIARSRSGRHLSSSSSSSGDCPSVQRPTPGRLFCRKQRAEKTCRTHMINANFQVCPTIRPEPSWAWLIRADETRCAEICSQHPTRSGYCPSMRSAQGGWKFFASRESGSIRFSRPF
ncbi:hypothetical protein ABW21_db0203794 [Orbilia brochopaga]|nr:hypothetical protein ABW21_db0203794 [Drechslerella brochopaga]